MEISGIRSDLYPDLVEAGGLVPALQLCFENLGSKLVVDTAPRELPFAYANVERDARCSQLCIATKHRAFSADFWDHGVQYGSGWTTTLDEAARSVQLFLIERATTADLGSSFAWVEIGEQAHFHEVGPSAFVDHAWCTLLDWLNKEPTDSQMGRLVPLIMACMNHPRLRQLMPYTSHDVFCLSRRTSCGYEPECAAHPIGVDRFRTRRGELSEEGDARHIAAAMEASLPPDCPPAFHE